MNTSEKMSVDSIQAPTSTASTQIEFRQFLTRFSTSDSFLAMLKISTEHGSGSSAMESCVSEIVNNTESIGRSFLLFIIFYRNSSAVFAWACSKVNEA